MQPSKSGFSLVELMAVVAIIAIVSVLAIPQYRSYSERSKIAQAMVLIDNIGEQAKIYYDKNGVFPNLQQLGLYHDPMDPNQSPMANNLGEYMAKYIAYTYIMDQGSAYTCPAVAFGGYISNVSPGNYITTSQNGSVLSVNEMIVYVNRTFKKYCQYYYSKYDPDTDTSTNVTGNFVGSCVNGEEDPNAGNYFVDAANQC